MAELVDRESRLLIRQCARSPLAMQRNAWSAASVQQLHPPPKASWAEMRKAHPQTLTIGDAIWNLMFCFTQRVGARTATGPRLSSGKKECNEKSSLLRQIQLTGMP